MINNRARELKVCSYKYNRQLHRTWKAYLSQHLDSLIVLEGQFADEVHHPLLGLIERGTHSTEYYWTDRWYSIFRFNSPGGALRNFYCNVNEPVVISDDLLTFVDLDIDVVVAPDFTYKVLDEDEFALHSNQYNYPLEVRRQVHHALLTLIRLIEHRDFPFSEDTSQITTKPDHP